MDNSITLRQYNELQVVLNQCFRRLSGGDVLASIDFEDKAKIYEIVTGKKVDLDNLTLEQWESDGFEEVVMEAINFSLPKMTKSIRTFSAAAAAVREKAKPKK